MLSFFFPGQGSQVPGMGKRLATEFSVAKQVFEEADDALRFGLSKLCFEGSEDELKRTEITQPALLTTSFAAYSVLAAERPELTPSFLAGHSLGEWSALVAAGALSLADGVKLVRTRGQLMQEAVPDGQGAMTAVIGLSAEDVTRACIQVSQELGQVVSPANLNGPDQTVISGTRDAVKAAEKALETLGAKRIVPLTVSAPFHCALMSPAAEGLEKALEPIAVKAPVAPIVSNVEAKPHQDAECVKPLLVKQVTAPVRWVETVEHIAGAGGTLAIEFGVGKVLMGLVRRIDRRLKVCGLEDSASLKKVMEALPS